jgi:hypothetical protein
MQSRSPPARLDVRLLQKRIYTQEGAMIRKLKSGEYRLYSRKVNPRTGKRRNLGTFRTLAAAKKHERAVQFFKRH